ncbi:MAG TPA: hypothetical protein VM140_03455 [Burkholderiales bacterium]|nr:hypothetical protein [Burkholderiales bacterium]
MNPTAIYSKSGKGVQEASGKTSFLDRGDRAVLSAIDGRATLADVAQKVGKTFDNAFQTLIAKLDKDGFIREASPGAAAKSAAPAAKAPAGKPPPKAASKSEDAGEDLDFSSLGGAPKAAPAPSRPAAPPPRPAAPPPPPPPPKPNPAAEAQAKAQQSALQKAREEAEAKAQAERDKQRAEAEAKIRSETETKLRAEALAKAKAEAEDKIRAEAEAKAKAVRDAAVKAAAEARAKADAEAKARQEVERKAKEEIERAKKAAEEEARRAREEADRARKAAEEEARKAREEAERARKEAERARKEAEEATRKAREEAERKAKEEADAMRRQLEEERRREEEERAARRKAEEHEQAERRKAREEEDRRHEEERAAKRKQRDEADEAERREEEERAARRKRERQEEESQPQPAAAAPKAKKKEEAPAKSEAAGGLDSLMADLDSFTTREEEERKEKEESDRKAKEAATQRAREDAERNEREEAERKVKEEARARKEEEKRRKREEEEELARKREAEEERLRKEEEKRKREADERERKAKADEVLAAKATRGPAVAVGEDTDEVRKRMVGRRGGPAAPMGGIEAPSLRRKKSGWGKPVAITLVLLLVAAVGVIHVLPVPTADYERAASEALGKPVKIGEARMSLVTGLQLKFKDIRLGDEIRIASGAGVPEFEALRGEKKVFSRIELEGVELPQEAIGEALLAKVKADNFAVGRVVVHGLKLVGPAPLPGPLEADLVYGDDGALRSATVRGPDTLLARITPAAGSIEYVVTASGFPLPVLPEVTLSDFGMKGTATQRGMAIAEWGGKIFGGSVSGTANVRWGSGWTIDGVVTARNINAAVFAPALLSEGKGEGTGRFSMSGSEPAKLGSGGRLEGNFTIGSGVLGSFDLGRVIRSSGKEYAGRTQFTELTGQATYDRGAISLRNVTIGAGAMNAGASADIAQSGALTGRIVADVKSGTGRAVGATVQLGGTVKEPQVRN